MCERHEKVSGTVEKKNGPGGAATPRGPNTEMQEASVNKSSLTKSGTGATGISFALAAALVAALAAFLIVSAKDAGAQDQSVKVSPSNIDLGDISVGSTDPTDITFTNNGDTDTTIGGIDLNSEGLQGLDLESIRLIDPETGQEFAVDTVTGLLQLLDDTGQVATDPLTGLPILGSIDIPSNGEKVIQLVTSPTAAGPVNAVINFLDDDPLTNTVVQTVTVAGEARNCTVPGTPGNDTLTDTPGDDVICGGDGDDTINAPNGGNDVVIGEAGNDTISIKDRVKKNDTANGGSGKDVCKKDKKEKVASCGKSAKKAK